MFRLSNLVTALFGIIAALGAILGISSLTSINRTVTEPGEVPANSLDAGDGVASLNPDGTSAPRQVGQNAASTGTPIVTADGETTPQNPTDSVFSEGEGAILSNQPAAPTAPSEAVAVQLDPSPGVVPASVSAPSAPVAQAPETTTAPTAAPAPAPKPVRAMW